MILERGELYGVIFNRMTQAPPSGYLKRKIAQSAEEAIAQYSADHIKTIAKAAIQKYIASFLDRDGGNREILKVFSKMGLQYITDKSFDAASDSTLRKTQLARLFENLKTELPAILIMDSGFDYIHQNWLGIDRSWQQNGEWYANALICRNLKITIAVGTRDQSTTDFLQGLLSVMFGEMKFISAGNRLTGNFEIGETWVLKIGPPTLGTVNQNRIPEDPKDAIWTFNIDLDNVLFEDTVTFKQPLPKFGGPRTGVMNEPDLGWTPPIIYLEDEIPINETARVLFDLFQPDFHHIIIKDPNIATFEPQSRTISPRRLGTTELQVIRNRRDLDNEIDQQTGSKGVVVATKVFKVTPPQ